MAEKQQPKTVGEAIREARQAHGYSTWHLARLSGVSQSSIVRIEGNHGKQPSLHHLGLLAPVLDLARAELFTLAGYTAATDLPTLPTYLRAKFGDIPGDAQTDVDQFVAWFEAKYDLKPPGDRPHDT